MRNIFIFEKQTIAALQNQFSLQFPYLKLVFFRGQYIKGELSSKDKMVRPQELVGNIQSKKSEGNLFFTGQTTAGELEENFFNQFGLCTQVFRKSGGVWLATTATDNWTLEHQNEEARSLIEDPELVPEDLRDHDIY